MADDGAITNVIEEFVGSHLEVDAAAGATTITPTDIDIFNIEGGEAQIGDPDDGPSEAITYTVNLDADGEPTGTLALAIPLANSYTAEADTPIILTLNGALLVERYAYFGSDTQDEDQRALVPTDFYDRLPLSSRDDASSEWAMVDYDPEGQLKIGHLDAQVPTQTGEFIEPDTLPYQADGFPPASSPAAVVTGGPKFIGVAWDAVTNADPVTYEVHIDTVSGFTPTALTLVALVWEGNGYVITALPDGSPLAFDTTYYIRVVATDIDGAAAPGAEDSGQLVRLPSDAVDPDGVPPASSPTPTVQGGPNYLAARWAPVTNADPVTYEVHISATTGFTPGPGTLYQETHAESMLIKTLAGGGALVYGATYYVKIVAKDADGAAAASAQGSASMVQIDGGADIVARSIVAGDVALNTLTGNEILAGSINADRITVGTLTADRIQAGTFSSSSVVSDKFVAGSIAGDRIVANSITTNQLSATAIDAMTITGATYRTGSGVTWAGSGAGMIATSDGMRAFDGTAGTYELVASTGKVVIGALASETTRRRFEIDRNSLRLYGDTATADLTWTVLAVADPPGTGGTTNRGQMTTDTNTANARMWWDKLGLHSQYQNAGVNGGVKFRTFDFNPADALGMRLHTSTTTDALRIDPLGGATFKLAATDDPTGDLGARWVRQGDGTLAAKVWGDNLGDDTLHGQINMYAYGKTASGGSAQAMMKAQSATVPANHAAQVLATSNVASQAVVTARAIYAGTDSGSKTIIKHDGTSSFMQGTLGAGTGISVTSGAINPSVAIDTAVVPRLAVINTFTARNVFAPATDTRAADFRRGTDSAPTSDIVRFLSADAATVLANISPNGAGEFTNAGVATKSNAGAVSDLIFTNPVAGLIALDTTNNRIWARFGTSWKWAPMEAGLITTYTTTGVTLRRTLTPGTDTLVQTQNTLGTLIADLQARGLIA
jgi:hypothetical protein